MMEMNHHHPCHLELRWLRESQAARIRRGPGRGGQLHPCRRALPRGAVRAQPPDCLPGAGTGHAAVRAPAAPGTPDHRG
ncbi:hypothetical protein G6F35_008924 [Rhizopus arrhizus]|nr:hypothetical protein G6F35_008924 [Rhizopus arrhizus]KAG1387491.1 hypothetical protein G6F59_016382 [Rhizopus arrhizus]